MNTKTSRLLRWLPCSVRLAVAALASLSIVSPLRAAIDYPLNTNIWKMIYGVTAAQVGSPAWMAADDDMDGQSNGSEMAAGTNPFKAGSTISVTGLAPNGASNMDVSFDSMKGKQYVAQSSPSLTSPVWGNVGAPVIGTGVSMTLTVPKVPNPYYRVLVQDVDTDGDQVSDWAERVAGYDPSTQNTAGSPTNDHAALVGGVTSSNVVSVAVVDSTATQSASSTVEPVDTGKISVRRSGPLLFSSITVPLQKVGTAVEGTDYNAIPASVTFAADASEVILDVKPKANVNRKTNVTAIVKAAAGLGYTLGASTSGGVVIFPAGNTTGTGLTGQYHNTSSSTYSSQQTIFSGTVENTRTDVTVDFSSGVNGWGSTAGPSNLSATPSTNNAFSVRWTGQILPQYSETYFIDFRSDDSAKVWVDGKLLIDRWTTQSAADYINTIDLQAGVRYDIVIEYWNNASSTTAEAKLYWYSASQVKQIIPQNRLFPEQTQANKVTAITSALDAIGYAGTPFSFSITNPDIGGTVTYALDVNSGPLPPGLALNGTTGIVAGTPTVAGEYNVAINATNTAAGTTTGSTIVTFTIFPVGGVSREVLTVTGSSVASIVIPVGTPTNDTIATVDDDADYAPNTGERLRGYFVPPKTGNYYFWIAANNAAELWISNDFEYVNKVRRAVIAPAGSGKKVWNAQASQQTEWLYFVGGEKYYFEVLHNTGADADDHVAMGWCQDDIGTVPAVTGSANPTGATPVIPNGGAALQGYPLSGTVPGYAFQPYDYPANVASTGTLYACNLGPQAAAATTASGSASLRVDASGTFAMLKFAYQGLGSPKTAYHLHVDGYDTHSQGEIIYDIDDVDSFHPELIVNGEYRWDFTPGGTFPTAASLLDAIQRNKVYLNIHSVLFPAGEIRGTFGLVVGSQSPPNAAAYVDPGAPDDHATDAGAARFLNQATFGASPSDIAYVKANGFAAWIATQLTQPNSSTSADVVALLTADINNPYPSANFVNTWWKEAITGPDQLRQRLAFALSEILVISYNNDTGPLARNARVLADYYDNLIDYCLPTSGVAGSGNFTNLLKAVTLTPAMGLYLDMRANQLEDKSIGRHPNENYAREIMQLFSVGLYKMWDDGKLILDSKAELVPTYGQPEILGLAATFTGWNYAQALQSNGRLPTNFGPGSDYLNPMVLVPAQHERASKVLLNNVVLPRATGQTPRVSIASVSVASPCVINTSTVHGLKVGDTVKVANVTGGAFSAAINASHVVTEIVDTDSFKVAVNCTVAPTSYTNAVVTGATVVGTAYTTAGIAPVIGSQSDSSGATVPHPYDQFGITELAKSHDNIAANDNVPPYICKQLIQRLVTSNPSPGYVYRAVQKFRNNGSGVRGDLAAVVTQILMDGEARNSAAAQASTTFGKQREPLLRVTGPARGFPTVPYAGIYTQLSGIDSNKFRIVTSTPNDFSSGFTVSLDFTGNYVPANQTLSPYNNPTSTAYSIASTLGISGVAIGNPATVTTVTDHGLTPGDSVTIASVGGGVTTPTINATYVVTVTGANTFTVPVNCTVPTTANTGNIVGANTLTVNATGIQAATYTQAAGSNILTVNTSGPPTNGNVLGAGSTKALTALAQVGNPCVLTCTNHGLGDGNGTAGTTSIVSISGITDGAFSPSINGVQTATVINSNTFSVPVNCTGTPSVNGSFTRTAKSRVYISFLTQTSAGGAAIAADGIYDVQTTGTNLFTVTTVDTPVTARGGNAMMPKIAASYTVESSTLVRFNTSVNHSLQIGQHVWVDTPVQGGAPVDGEFAVSVLTDEDHLKVPYPPLYPVPSGAYSNPSGSQNGVTIWPLVPPPTGRSGVVKVNQATFVCNGTNGTLSQTPFNSPTVFNFFYPDYKYPGSLANNNLNSPEFQLSTDTDIVNLTNSLTNMFIGTGGGNGNQNGLSSYNNGGGAIVFDIGEFMTPARTSNAGIPTLIDDIANRLVGAPLNAATKAAIQTLVANTTNFPYTTPTPTNPQMRDRVRSIIHQITVSAEYAVQK